jgi:hypothetical protein
MPQNASLRPSAGRKLSGSTQYNNAKTPAPKTKNPYPDTLRDTGQFPTTAATFATANTSNVIAIGHNTLDCLIEVMAPPSHIRTPMSSAPADN